MTTNELRDRLAELTGWSREQQETSTGLKNGWRKGGVWYSECPTPDTLDGLAALWPEEWWWSKYETPATGVKWTAGPRGGFGCIEIFESGNEYADRLALTVAVYEKIKEQAHV